MIGGIECYDTDIVNLIAAARLRTRQLDGNFSMYIVLPVAAILFLLPFGCTPAVSCNIVTRKIYCLKLSQ